LTSVDEGVDCGDGGAGVDSDGVGGEVGAGVVGVGQIVFTSTLGAAIEV